MLSSMQQMRPEHFYGKRYVIILLLAAINVPKAAPDFKDIDRALVWGFNWKKDHFNYGT